MGWVGDKAGLWEVEQLRKMSHTGAGALYALSSLM